MSASDEPVLVDLQHLPACAKVRACLQLKGIPFRRTPASCGLMRRLRRTEPTVEPPVLLAQARTFAGADAIVAWMEREKPAPALRPEDAVARSYCRLLEGWADRVLGALVGAIVWSGNGSTTTARDLAVEIVPAPLVSPVACWVRRRARRRYGVPTSGLEARLADALGVVEHALHDRRYLLGEALTVADVALYVQLARLRPVLGEDAMALGPQLAAWRARLDDVEAVRTATP